MKCQSFLGDCFFFFCFFFFVFGGREAGGKKIVINLSSAEFAQRMVKFNRLVNAFVKCSYFVTLISLYE